MIRVEVTRDKRKCIKKVMVRGHSGYDDIGKDIVCAAVSGIVQTAVLGLTELLNISISLEMDEGFMCLILPANLEKDLYQKTGIILETMVLGLKEIEKVYTEYIRVVVKEGGV